MKSLVEIIRTISGTCNGQSKNKFLGSPRSQSTNLRVKLLKRNKKHMSHASDQVLFKKLIFVKSVYATRIRPKMLHSRPLVNLYQHLVGHN